MEQNNNNNNVFELPAIVMDFGAATCRAGFAGEDAPRSEFAACIGRPKYPKVCISLLHNS